MFIFGHSGIAAVCVRAIDRRSDLRWVVLGALIPDVIDKPCALIFPDFANGWSRLGAHSLTGLCVFAAIVAIARGRRAWAPIIAFASHLVLDRMWEEPRVLLWPFLGFWFPPHPIPYLERFWAKFTNPWVVGGEIVGLAIVVALGRRGGLGDRERRRRFFATGVIEGDASAASPP